MNFSKLNSEEIIESKKTIDFFLIGRKKDLKLILESLEKITVSGRRNLFLKIKTKVTFYINFHIFIISLFICYFIKFSF